ncbi:MAG TPA: SurA N-terminal domain-containing protein [Tahibacter sp.]|uniref:SurA N-terminal domain-containing protein n=1 Tax=Tahibacter sp. TaxID=2056211 RepID=UPI002C92A2A9|nr:SurA N-terminal domain-containing protein [Tahibacter sp.]HSX61661.1 SurA N-terminal domain-containing protein [Tahibacter sp.]
MLQSLRDKTSGLIAKIVLGALIIVFSFFGIESYFVGRNDTWVAKVDKAEISAEQFRDRFQSYRQNVLQRSGGQLDPALLERPEIKRQVLDALVDEQLLLNANEKLGIVITDDRVRELIRSIPQFQVEGKFDENAYRATLAGARMSPLQFQEDRRKALATDELRSLVGSIGIVTAHDIDAHIRLRDQTRDLRTLTIPKPADAPKIDDAEVENFYKSHSSEYMTAEQVSLEYVEFDAKAVKIAETPDESVLLERYEREKSRYLTPEQRLVSHILITAKGGDADAQKAALAKAQQIAKTVRDGKDFAAAAKESSEDLGSKAQGGDLGWIEAGVADAAFEAALFAMKKGEVSEPVLSGEGYHIIQLRDIRERKEKTFAEVKPELTKAYLDTERERVFGELAGKVADEALNDSGSLAAAAKAAGVEPQKTALFPRTGGTGIAANPAVIKAAFSDGVLVQGSNSDLIDLAPDHKVVVRIADHKRSEPRPLDEVREEIRARLVRDAVAKQARERADALLERLRKGEKMDAIAAELKLSVTDAKGTGRNAANIDSRIAQAAFKLPRPAEGKPEFGSVSLIDDAYALFEVDKVVDGDVAKVDEAGREAIRNQLQSINAMVATNNFVASLRKSAKIQIAEDRMQ